MTEVVLFCASNNRAVNSLLMKRIFKAANAFLFLMQDEESRSTRLRRLIPVLGSSEAFVASLQKFNKAKLKEDLDSQRMAREQGLSALLDTMTDTALLLSVLGPFRVLRVVFSLTYVSRSGRLLGIPEIDASLPLAKQLLRSKEVRNLMEQIFEGVRRALASASGMDRSFSVQSPTGASSSAREPS